MEIVFDQVSYAKMTKPNFKVHNERNPRSCSFCAGHQQTLKAEGKRSCLFNFTMELKLEDSGTYSSTLYPVNHTKVLRADNPVNCCTNFH